MRLLVLQHINCEPPGIYEDVLREHDIEIARIELDEGEALPPWEGFDGIVAMGGPMSAYDDQQFAWLIEEKRLISAAVRAGVPYWGVCLGAQLLASALEHLFIAVTGPKSEFSKHRLQPRVNAIPSFGMHRTNSPRCSGIAILLRCLEGVSF